METIRMTPIQRSLKEREEKKSVWDPVEEYSEETRNYIDRNPTMGSEQSQSHIWHYSPRVQLVEYKPPSLVRGLVDQQEGCTKPRLHL